MSDNTKLLKKLAETIQEILPDVVFVGSIILEYLIDENLKEAIHLRSTEDIDLTVKVSTKNDFYKTLEKFREKGFKEDINSPNLCRLKKKDIQIDIIPSQKNILGFTNRWYEKGIKKSTTIKISEQIEIKILSAPYFLASKLKAFFSRGIQDPYTSKDLEDIVTIINGREGLIEEIQRCEDEELKKFLLTSINKLLENEKIIDAIYGHFYNNPERAGIILKRLEKLRTIGDIN